jgi:hypothetical protein
MLKKLQVIKAILVDFGYAFKLPNPIVLADDTDSAQINRYEYMHGMLPTIIKAWYNRIRMVDYSQDENQLYGRDCFEGHPASGLGVFCNTMVNELGLAIQEKSTSFRNDALSFIPLGPFCSNCDPMGIDIPGQCFDPVYFNDGNGDQYFIDEWESNLSAGGFPYWSLGMGHKMHFLVPRPSPEIVYKLKNAVNSIV